jgi:uncharacterized protein YbjT (DUF2867 family)
LTKADSFFHNQTRPLVINRKDLPMKCIILGATGLVGQQLLAQALADPRITEVIAPTRKPLPAAAKLTNPIVDFAQLPEQAVWWQADVALCALGTTLKQAGSKSRFIEVDHDYVLQSAKLMRKAGTPVFVYNSSLGANPHAKSFYLQVKGQIETDLSELGFQSLGIVRPSLLDGGPRPDNRVAERIGLVVAKLLGPVVPQRYRAVKTDAVAAMMWQLATTAAPGTTIVGSAAIYQMQQDIQGGR